MTKAQVLQVLQEMQEMPDEFHLDEFVECLIKVRDEADRIEFARLAENLSEEEILRRKEFVALVNERIEQSKTEKSYTYEEAREYFRRFLTEPDAADGK